MSEEGTVKSAVVFNCSLEKQRSEAKLLQQRNGIACVDNLLPQLRELIKLQRPSQRLDEQEANALIAEKFPGEDALSQYGCWVYYPWRNLLVRTLSEEDFIAVRTNRNKLKITQEEQDELATKSIGIIGMSVGRSVALTIAMERGAGEIRIADFDNLDLSNLNRLKAPIWEIGMAKTVSVSREIAEIDPFLKVVTFDEGVNEDNVEAFLLGNGKLDLLVDECDSLEVKIMCREKAKKFRIPVVMETSDRGMLDIERFDLEPGRPLLHGLADVGSAQLKGLGPEERFGLLMKIVQFDLLSERAKKSIGEIGKTVSTWPQLASDVVKGGGVVAEISRKILLKQINLSGRYYMDVDKILG